MREIVRLQGIKENREGTELLIKLPGRNISDFILQNHVKSGEIYLPDGREITPDQRKKIYATIRDIADHTGYLPEEAKEHLKYEYVAAGQQYLSLSSCSVTEAREFINFLLDFAIQNGIRLTGNVIDRSDDVARTLWQCIKHRKCCICGQHGEVHHVDHIGLGYDRRTKDDSMHRKMCLCRKHHTEVHTLGEQDFCEKYHVFGVIYNQEGGEDKIE